MPYEIIDEGIGLVFRFGGNVATKDLMAANAEGWEHPNWQSHRYQIWDYADVETITMEEPDPLLIAKMDSVAFRTTLPMKIAFIANSQQIVDFCESYIASLVIENMEARTFSDEVAARQWLDG